MSVPILLVAINGAAVVALSFMHDRKRASALVAAAASILVALFALLAPIDQALEILGGGWKFDPEYELLGRRLVLEDSNRAVVGFLYGTAAFLFAGGWLSQRGRYFYSAGLLLIGSLAGALMVRPFLFAAIFLELAALAAVLMLAAPNRTDRSGAQRILVFFSLAMVTVLASGWLIETGGLTGSEAEGVAQITRLLGLGFAVLLFVPPFHLWLPKAAERADPYSLVFVAVSLHSSAYFFLLQFLNAYEWLRLSPDLALAMRAGGGAMVLAGGLWALVQKDAVKATVFLLLADLGVSLLVAGRGTVDSYALGLGLAAARVVGVGLWALALGLLERAAGGTARADLRGAAYTNPLPALAMTVGMLSLAGVPLTAGFPGRWAAIGTFGKPYVLSAGLVVLGLLLSSAAVVRWLMILLDEPEAAPGSLPESGWERFYLLGGIALCTLLGLLPQLLYPWVIQVVRGLSNLTVGA